MKVLIVENMFRGHYYLYLNYILPRLANLVESVDVAITSEGRNSPEFTTYLGPLEKCAVFHPILASPGPTDRLRLHLNMREAVRRFAPDYVLVPSGDAETSPMGLFRIAGRGGLPAHPPPKLAFITAMGPRKPAAKTGLKTYSTW